MQEIYVDDIGTGFPLVLVHGYLGSSEMWNLQKENLSKHFRIITLALHGFSESHKTNSLRAAIERFSRRLTGRYQRPVTYVDERLSSYAANYDEQATTNGLDAAAAKMILLTWLEQPATIGTAASQ